VGGNVSLYNDSAAGPIPPTPTLAMVGVTESYDAPPVAVAGEGDLLVVGAPGGRLGGSEYLARTGGSDRFPDLPETPAAVIDALADVATRETTLAVHDVSHGGLAVTLAEMVESAGAGAGPGTGGVSASVDSPTELFDETPGRAVVETTDPTAVGTRFDGVAPVERLGEATETETLSLDVGAETLTYDAAELSELRDVLARELD
jgi:phosphoribosylformylglycinamidine synthase